MCNSDSDSLKKGSAMTHKAYGSGAAKKHKHKKKKNTNSAQLRFREKRSLPGASF